MVVDCMDELDCASKCRSVQHGDLIYAIGTKGSDSEVINLWMRTCQNYPRVKDRFGRSAIHVSATMGRAKVKFPRKDVLFGSLILLMKFV